MRTWKHHSILLAAIVAVAIALSSCSGFREPKVTLTDVELVGISGDGIEFEMTALMENPNDFSASIERVEYSIHGDGIELAKGERTEGVPVPAHGSAEVKIPFILRWKGSRTILESLFDDSKHEWQLGGSVELRKGLITKTFPFSESGIIHSPSWLTEL